MTRGTASPSHDPETPISGVPATRPTFAEPRATNGITGGTTFSKVLVVALVSVFVVAAISFVVAASGARRETTPAPGATAGPVSSAESGAVGEIAAGAAGVPASMGLTALAQASLGPIASAAASPVVDPLASSVPASSVDPAGSGDPPASVGPGLATDPAAIVELHMPMVPVTGFWATDTAITRSALTDALEGHSSAWDRVLVPAGDRAAIEEALGITIAGSVEEATPAAIERAMKAKKARVLGILRAADVSYRVRALGIGGSQLFGNDRVRNVDNWPLVATVQGPAGRSAWDQKATWTLVAGGDSFTDRGIYERVVNRNKGLDYPFAGGTARVTGHYCCGPFVTPGHPVPSYKLSGPKGIVRDMVKNADLAIANHESPIPNDWAFHLHGFIFSGKPALTEIFARAGIDFFSLANNHIKDYGTDGVVDTLANLDKFGIKHAGAGKDLAQARKYAIMQVKGVKVAIIPCVAVAPFSWATTNGGGGTPCKKKYIIKDIKDARTKADFVIVFPHWGAEYNRSPVGNQRSLAAAWVAAGADLVLGAHSHVAGAIEEIDGSPVFYSMGNFIFDQNWATYTMESVLLEMTFKGDQIVQIQMHPFLSHDQAQPNFLQSAKDDGKALMKDVRRVSFIDW